MCTVCAEPQVCTEESWASLLSDRLEPFGRFWDQKDTSLPMKNQFWIHLGPRAVSGSSVIRLVLKVNAIKFPSESIVTCDPAESENKMSIYVSTRFRDVFLQHRI